MNAPSTKADFDTDVIIVGAGPTGLALATTLHRAGVATLIVDKLETGQNTSRAAVIHAHTLEVLEAIGVSKDLAREGVRVTRFSLGRTSVCAGAQASKSLSQSVEGVEAIVQSRTGRETLRARYVIGADGMNSIVRRTAGIGFSGSNYEDSFVLADVDMEWGLGRDEVMLFFSPTGLLVVAPLPNGRFRLVATVDKAHEKPGVADMQALLVRADRRKAPGKYRACIGARASGCSTGSQIIIGPVASCWSAMPRTCIAPLAARA